MSSELDDVPKYNELMWPTVVALRSLGGSGSIAEIDETVIDQQGYSDKVQSVLLGMAPGRS